ncbi:DUF3347 domain-containing protein [Gilvibacter sediminis]|uniref:DUF3347 domain-containing protein n=1 Tax=Gilvibacter sediminis TaxID=379071 RepID=UPI00234FD6BF|nr:DUF3347 domain-containing protein [Gilvibacter sediminis]MDC7997420.1 DUF3347 domain-containing protein [Gilvibacter sediminis]
MRIPSFLILSFLLLCFTACKDEAKQAEDTTTESAEPQAAETAKTKYEAAATTAKFKDPKVGPVFDAYIALKTTLVNSDVEATSQAADALLTAFSNMGVDEETFLAAQFVMESKEIAAQRDGFNKLTPIVEQMVVDNIEGGAVYKQYCPMAFNNTGAYWLSNSKEIYNPYFGDMMLNCGRVSDTFEAAASN